MVSMTISNTVTPAGQRIWINNIERNALPSLVPISALRSRPFLSVSIRLSSGGTMGNLEYPVGRNYSQSSDLTANKGILATIRRIVT